MARIWAQGFDSDVAAENNAGGGSNLGNRPTADSSRLHPRGHGWGLGIRRNRATAVATRPAHMATNPRTVYQRFYIRVRRTPTTAIASNKCWQQVSAAAAAETAGMYLTTAGAFAMYHGNSATGTLLGSFSYTLNQWHLIEIQITYDNIAGVSSNGFLEWKIDGAAVFSGQPSGAGAGSVNSITLMASSQLGSFNNTHDFEVDFDDWSGDTAAYPGYSVIRTALITGPGTYNDFSGTGGSPSWINQRTLRSDQSTSTTAPATSAVNGQIQSYAIDLSQIQNIGNVLAFNIIVAATGPGTQTWDVLLRINGVDNYVRLGTSIPNFPGGSDWIDISLFPFTASDTLEIGIRKVTGGASVLTLRSIWMMIEHDGVEDPTTYDGDETVRMSIGNYTGTGSAQTLALGFVPDFLLIWGASQFSVNALIWSDVIGPFGTYATRLDGLDMHDALSFTAAGVLAIAGGTAGVNDSGTVYSYIAVRDRPQRMFARGAWAGRGSDDNVVISVNAPTFTADAAIGLRTTNSSLPARIRGAGYVGDLSSQWTSAASAAADGVQAIAAGSIELGATLASNSGGRVTVYGLRQGAFEQTTLFETLTWVGNASNPRNIPCALITGPLAAVIVTPHNNAARAMRSTGQSSSATEGTTSATAITALGSGQFTVNSSLNANGVTYTAYVFAAGEDEPLPVGFDDYWVTGYDGLGHFPNSRTLIVPPAGKLSRGRTVTVLEGTPLAAYGASNLTDDTMQTVVRLVETYGLLRVDMGAPVTPHLAGVWHHNFDDGLILGVVGSNNADLSVPVFSWGMAARDPSTWIDLRGFTFSAARYWGLHVPIDTPNSRPIAVGEFVVATAEAFDGILDPDWELLVRFFTSREPSDFGVRAAVVSGAKQRGIRIPVTADAAHRATLEAILDAAGLNGQRLVVVPDSRLNESFFIDPTLRWQKTYPKAYRVATLPLDLVEESPGTV